MKEQGTKQTQRLPKQMNHWFRLFAFLNCSTHILKQCINYSFWFINASHHPTVSSTFVYISLKVTIHIAV